MFDETHGKLPPGQTRKLYTVRLNPRYVEAFKMLSDERKLSTFVEIALAQYLNMRMATDTGHTLDRVKESENDRVPAAPMPELDAP
jgi:hypothetical protein